MTDSTNQPQSDYRPHGDPDHVQYKRCKAECGMKPCPRALDVTPRAVVAKGHKVISVGADEEHARPNLKIPF